MFLALAAVLTAVTLGLTLILITIRSKVSLVVRVFRQAGHGLRDMPALFVPPVVFVASIILWTAALLLIAATLWTVEDSTAQAQMLFSAGAQGTTIADWSMPIVVYTSPAYVWVLLCIALVAYVWLALVLAGIVQLGTAAVVSVYVLRKRQKNAVTFLTVCTCFVRTVRYHTGSLALASLVAIASFPLTLVFGVLRCGHVARRKRSHGG